MSAPSTRRPLRVADRADGNPTVLAVIGDVAHPLWRVRAVVGGVGADICGLGAAVWAAAGITLASAGVVRFRMYETHPVNRRVAT